MHNPPKLTVSCESGSLQSFLQTQALHATHSCLLTCGFGGQAALRSAYLCTPVRSTALHIHVSVSQAASLLTRCVGLKGDNDPVSRCRRWDALLAIITEQMKEPSRTPPSFNTGTMSSSCFQTEATRTPTSHSVK